MEEDDNDTMYGSIFTYVQSRLLYFGRAETWVDRSAQRGQSESCNRIGGLSSVPNHFFIIHTLTQSAVAVLPSTNERVCRSPSRTLRWQRPA